MSSNHEKWRLYTAGLSSPDNYIDWGWYYTVVSALQRRVWLGPPHQACFPNMYVILVGSPGIGKGLVIREVSSLLKFWKQEDGTVIANGATVNPEDKQQVEITKETDMKKAQDSEYQGKTKGQDMTKPLLIPVSADAITYEALVNAVADSFRRINYVDPLTGKLKIYGHSSLCFALQELSSLMRKRTNDTVNYLLGLYDCPVDYEYVTLTRGKDRVRRGCLNLLAGTTPSFMQSTFDEKLTDEGFSSRTFYIFSKRNRKNQFWIPPLTKEQEEARIHLLTHIKNLTALYGNVTIDQQTVDYLHDWWNDQEENRFKRSNKSLKMMPYYSRKNIHVMKLAMAIHFSESVILHIPLETFKKAIEILDKEEKNMHLALSLEGDNPESKVTRKLLSLLETGRKNFVELLVELHSIASKQTLESSLSLLMDTNQIRRIQILDDTTQENIAYFELVTDNNTTETTVEIDKDMP